MWGSLPAAPTPTGPTVLLSFRGLREGSRHRAVSLSWECFQVRGWHNGVSLFCLMMTPGTQRGSSGKEDKGDVLVLGQGGDGGGAQVTFSTSRWY